MASLGPNSAGAATNNSAVGVDAWNTTGTVFSSDNSRTFTSNFSALPRQSYYLVVTQFGFSVPSGATINGIVVEIERSENSPNANAVDVIIAIVKGGTIGSTNKASATEWPTTDTYATYGGSTDLWGETWTSTDINATNFGVAISSKHNRVSPKGSGIAQIDHVRITVYYTESAGGGSPSITSDIILFN